MEKYEIIKRLGGGSFADVYLGKEYATAELVAIKVLKKKYRKLEQCYELREVVSLQKLCKENLSSQKGYDNIIKLKEIIFEKKAGKLSLVFEYMETDLYELMKKRAPSRLSEEEIKDMTYQILLGLFHMHKYGYFHRDMKPENLLITGKKVKIADFGLAREIRSIPPFTEYVSTRYYRAPECILRSQNYNSPVDIWAVGCIMAEMYMHPMPLFYGASEKEVFVKICTTLGSPNKHNWNEGVNQASKIGIKYPQSSGTDLANIVIGASPDAIDVMKQMLQWSPNARATAANLLRHPFFSSCGYDLRVTNTNFFNDFGDVKAFNKTNRRFRPNPNNNNNENNNNEGKDEEKEKNNKNNNDDNMFSKLLNDTEGFNKLLNQLKKEENEENKNFEKNNFKYKNDIGLNEDKTRKNYASKINSNNNNNKIIIKEEKEIENESDSEDKNSKNKWNKRNSKVNNDKYDDFNFDIMENKTKEEKKIKKDEEDDDFKYLFNSDTKSNLRNIGLKDNFRRDSSNKKKDEFDFLFNTNDKKKETEDKYDNYFKKNNEKDISNIDSEINKILSKDIGLTNNLNNNIHKNFNNQNNNNNNNDMMLRFKSQKITHSNNINGLELDKPYERNSNLKPIGRRGGGGLKALGYEPNKKSILDDLNFGGGLGGGLGGGVGLGLNRKKENNVNNRFGYKKDLGPIIMKEKNNDNYYGINNNNYNNNNKEDKYGLGLGLGNLNLNKGNNNNFGRKDKFSLYEKNNPIFNQFNSDMIGPSRRKRNFYSSPNNFGWEL